MHKSINLAWVPTWDESLLNEINTVLPGEIKKGVVVVEGELVFSF